MSKEAYLQAVDYFADTVAKIGSVQWDESALGVWSVRDLVGHVSRAITRIEEFGQQRADKVDVESAAEHYHISLAPDGTDDMIAESGKIAGGELGDDPLSVIKDAIATMRPVLDSTPGDTLIAYTNGGIVFDHYLETRILELTVHTLDLQTALGLSDEPPREALLATLHLLAELAAGSGCGGQLALLATGRGIIPDRFSVLG
jgi:uncharacterized protein (TIGR03083 family)